MTLEIEATKQEQKQRQEVKRRRDLSQNMGVGGRTTGHSGPATGVQAGGDPSGRGNRTRTAATTTGSRRCQSCFQTTCKAGTFYMTPGYPGKNGMWCRQLCKVTSRWPESHRSSEINVQFWTASAGSTETAAVATSATSRRWSSRSPRKRTTAS